MIRSRKLWIIDTILLGLTTFILVMYVAMDVPVGTVHSVKLALDDSIPRIPVFVIPYLAFLPWLYGTLIYAWFKNRYFRQLAYVFIIINLIAFLVYLVYQTVVPRDPIDSTDIFSAILKFVYDNNLPYAGLPSLHSGLSASIATYCILMKGKWSWAAVGMAALIVISTLFTKQHFILDAVSGVTLGVVVTWVVFRVIKKK